MNLIFQVVERVAEEKNISYTTCRVSIDTNANARSFSQSNTAK